ncbi:hypothetical protein R3P38DRAFT_3547991 [Favolaschia claudopus]|uniref:Uncharacterized protein n=1 Tax=Favolaschia claudopus TaxID=2862362 RepID=A0AAW0B429_9AGAR
MAHCVVQPLAAEAHCVVPALAARPAARCYLVPRVFNTSDVVGRDTPIKTDSESVMMVTCNVTLSGASSNSPPDSAANVVVDEVVSAEEEAAHETYKKKLRTRLSQWYCGKYGNLLKSDEKAFQKLFTGPLDGAPPKPHRQRLQHFYSRHYYSERIAPIVGERIESMKRRAELAGEPELDMKRVPIDVVAKATADAWAAETPAFQHECEVAAEEEYKEAIEGWRASLADSPTRTPEQMAAGLALVTERERDT